MNTLDNTTSWYEYLSYQECCRSLNIKESLSKFIKYNTYYKTVMDNKMEKMKDTLNVTQNENGSFQITWDKNDEKWNFLNSIPSEELEKFISSYIKQEI